MDNLLLEITQDMVGIRLEQDFDTPGVFYLIHPAGTVQSLRFSTDEEGYVMPNYPAHFFRWLLQGMASLLHD